MKKTILSILIIFASIGTSYGQSTIAQDFKPVCDSLSRLIQERTSVKGELKTKAIMKRGNYLDFYFTESLGDYPWRINTITQNKTLTSHPLCRHRSS